MTEEIEVILETLLTDGGPRSRSEVLTLLCQKTVDVVGCDQAVIRLVDDERTVLREAAMWSVQPLAQRHVDLIRNETLAIGDLSGSIVRRGTPSPSLEAFRSGDIQIVAATDSNDEFLPAAMCVAPLIRRGAAIGVVAMYWLSPHRPAAAELARIRALARHAALVIEAAGAFEALSARVRATTQERDDLRADLDATERLVRFQTRIVELTAAGPPVADAVLALLATEGVTDPVLRFGDDIPGGEGTVPIAARGAAFGSLSWSPGETPVQREMLSSAALAIAVELDQRERERRLTAARHSALATLVQGGAAPRAIAEAVALLGIDESERCVLLVGEFTEADAAFAFARTIDLRLADGREDAPTAVAAGIRAIVLCRSERDLARLGERLRDAAGFRGGGVSRGILPGGWSQAVQDASTAARVSRTRGGRVLDFDEIGPLVALEGGGRFRQCARAIERGRMASIGFQPGHPLGQCLFRQGGIAQAGPPLGGGVFDALAGIKGRRAHRRVSARSRRSRQCARAWPTW